LLAWGLCTPPEADCFSSSTEGVDTDFKIADDPTAQNETLYYLQNIENAYNFLAANHQRLAEAITKLPQELVLSIFDEQFPNTPTSDATKRLKNHKLLSLRVPGYESYKSLLRRPWLRWNWSSRI
jgi:hypothetical protein